MKNIKRKFIQIIKQFLVIIVYLFQTSDISNQSIMIYIVGLLLKPFKRIIINIRQKFKYSIINNNKKVF